MSNIPIAPGNALTEFLYRKATQMRIPISGTFELSPVCNFSCEMCYVRKTRQEVAASPRPILTLEDWRGIARQAREAGMLDLLLTGGEPLLWPDFWTLYDELIGMGFQISINTNGSLIDREAVSRFVEKPPKQINITLYGASDESYHRLCGVRGMFDRVDQAIRELQKAQIKVKLNCSLTPRNAADLDWICGYAKERNLRLSVATYMFPPVRRDESMIGQNERFTPEEAAGYLLRYLELDRGEAAYRSYLQGILDGCVEPPGLDEGCFDPADGKVRCRAGRASFWVTWDGWLLPCGMLPQPRVDLKNGSFSDCWNILTQQTEQLRLSGLCENCPNHSICHPCAAIAWAETGSSAGVPRYMCQSTQQMYKLAQETLDDEIHSTAQRS